MCERLRRGYKVAPLWWYVGYRGKVCEPEQVTAAQEEQVTAWIVSHGKNFVYSEHDDDYLQKCLQNLLSKGIDLKIST
jgi:uncharacterized protein (TIGR02328 family)